MSARNGKRNTNHHGMALSVYHSLAKKSAHPSGAKSKWHTFNANVVKPIVFKSVGVVTIMRNARTTKLGKNGANRTPGVMLSGVPAT